MLLPGCRVDSLPRTRLAWLSTMLNDRFGVAMPRGVPRLRGGLVGEERGADVRAVDHLAQGVADVMQEVDGDPVAHRGRGGQDDERPSTSRSTLRCRYRTTTERFVCTISTTSASSCTRSPSAVAMPCVSVDGPPRCSG